MLKPSLSLLLSTLVAGSAIAQVPIPAHSNVYNGFTRGFNFVAQTSFNIVGLELPANAFQAGDTGSFLVRVNGTNALYSTGNPAGILAVNIPVIVGDNVDVLGNWSPAAPGNFTAHNSYGAATAGQAAPFPTTIEGVAHTLMRAGWQHDIGDPAYTGMAYLAPVAGQIGRINMYTAAGSGTVLATNTNVGAGCINIADVSSYELFAAGAFDLSNTAMSWLRTSSGYIAIPGVTTYVAPTGAAQVLALTDDSETTVTLSQAMPFGANGSTSTLTVCSNGFISSASGNGTGFTPTATTFLNGPQAFWSVGWHDYNPATAGSGQVKFEQVGNIAYITWDGVFDFAGPNPNTFQAQFDVTSGTVHVVYQTMSLLGNGHLVGYSDAGASADPGSMDISAALPATYTLAQFAVLPVTLTATSRPIIGTNWNFNVTNVPASANIGIDVFGVSDPGILDLSLFGLGQSGCQLRASLDVLNAYIVAGSTHAYSFAIPNLPSALSLHIFTQSAALQFPNLALTLTSNGVDGLLGDF